MKGVADTEKRGSFGVEMGRYADSVCVAVQRIDMRSAASP